MSKKIYRITFILLSLCVSFSSSAQKLSEIQINGLDRISRGTLLNYLPIETGDELTKELVDKSLKSLYDTGMFSKISAELKDQILLFNVSENPTIKYLFVQF